MVSGGLCASVTSLDFSLCYEVGGTLYSCENTVWVLSDNKIDIAADYLEYLLLKS